MRQAERYRLGTSDQLRTEDQPSRDRLAADPRHALRAPGRGKQPQPRLRETDACLLGDHAQVARQRQLEASSHRGAADFDHRHLRRTLQAREDLLHPARGLDHPRAPGVGCEQRAHHLQIGAGAEDTLIAADPEHRDAFVGLDAVQHFLEAVEPLVVDGVDRRAAKRCGSDRSIDMQGDHDFLSLAWIKGGGSQARGSMQV